MARPRAKKKKVTYIKSFHGDKTILTAMELLDIKEFNN